MKRLLTLMLALVMVFALAACDKDEGETPDNILPDTTADTTEAKLEEKAIVEELEGVGPVKLYNSYMELVIPEGYGYRVDDANKEAGNDTFQLILELKNSDGNDIGELLINNTGGLESVDEYVNALLGEYEGQDHTKVEIAGSEKHSVFDVRHITLDRGYMFDNYYYGYYKLPDATKEFRNVRFQLKIAGYYYKEIEFPTADFAELMDSIVIK